MPAGAPKTAPKTPKPAKPKRPALPESGALWLSYQHTSSVHRVGQIYGCSGAVIQKHLNAAGYKLNNSKWTPDDDLSLIRYYDQTPATALSADDYGRTVGRSTFAVQSRALKLGCNEPPEHRSKSDTARVTTAINQLGFKQQHEAQRTELGLPRHVPVKIHPDHRPAQAPSGRKRSGASARWRGGWYKIGEREIYFRSKWEVNYAHYLNWLITRGEILSWDFEPETFSFDDARSGPRTYLPDFKVEQLDGTFEYHEVKGFMDAASKLKLSHMAKYFPDIKMVLIDEQVYKSLETSLGGVIPGWLGHA